MAAPAFASLLDRLPGGYGLQAALALAWRRPGLEWRASPVGQALFAHPEPEGLRATPHDLRPADLDTGLRILAGAFVLDGETLAFGPRGDPWDRPSPSRRLATALHGFGWLKDLTVHGEPGAWEALRLTLAWRRLFGRWNAFAWDGPVLERRVFNLACHLAALSGPASDAEAEQVASDLARQARVLLALDDGPARAAERAAAAAVAGAALTGAAGDGLLDRALRRLARSLPVTVDPDGVHASRNPQATLELLFDLTTLERVLIQLGLAAPEAMLSALDRLAAAVRFLTLADGRLAAFQGGAALSASYVAAARAADAAADREPVLSRGGFHRLESRALQIVTDAGSPAPGPWSVTACAQPLAVEILAGGKRLIAGCGWSPGGAAPPALRLADAASTASVGEAPCGEPLRGFAARALGPRLKGAYAVSGAGRQFDRNAQWLEAGHDGWVRRFGLRHERRLYLDETADELRGEDALVPVKPRGGPDGRRFVAFLVRFHLPAAVSALIARDKKSVLIKAEGEETGWWLRNDALEATLEPSVSYEDGQLRHGQQVVLRGQARLETGGKVRWKLSPAHDRVETRVVSGAQVDAAEGSA